MAIDIGGGGEEEVVPAASRGESPGAPERRGGNLGDLPVLPTPEVVQPLLLNPPQGGGAGSAHEQRGAGPLWAIPAGRRRDRGRPAYLSAGASSLASPPRGEGSWRTAIRLPM